MSKSHYFVQKSPEEQLALQQDIKSKQVKECDNCGRLYVAKRKDQRYCCRDCYKQGVKKTKAEWFQKNKPRLMEKQRRTRRAQGMLSHKKRSKLIQARKYRNRIIKSGLVSLELYDFQIKPLRFESAFSFVNYPWKGFHKAQADLVKERLHELELYREDIEASDKYPLDFSEDNTGLIEELEPPQLPLKKEDAGGFLASYDIVKEPPKLL